MAYTTIPKSSAQFNPKLYTGNYSTNAITAVGFQPDLTWIKSRTTAGEDHYLFDAIRGVTNYIHSNTSAAQGTNSATLTTFGSDGFTVGANNSVNKSSDSLVSWNWKANGQGSANTDGTINSTYTSANTTSGFSIVQYTGNGTAGATVGHGLGAAVKTIIIKKYNTSSDWVYGSSGMGFTKYMNLNSTGAESAYAGMFNDTAPTSSVFTLGADGQVNTNGGTYVAYCFADVQGFSKMGSYIGNGNANGTFAYTGFKPAFILVKNTGSVRNWQIYDSKRIGYNYNNYRLPPNTAGSEESNLNIDIYSNGFKTLATDADVNENAKTYIFLAFAEEPLVSTNGQPATAR
jgi:hypothetical protein